MPIFGVGLQIFPMMRQRLLQCAVLTLAACTTSTPVPAPDPLALTPGKPVRIVMPAQGVTLQMTMRGIDERISQQIAGKNQSDTAWLMDLAKTRQPNQSLAQVFEADLKKKVMEKGGGLSESGNASVVRLDTLQVSYQAAMPGQPYMPQGLAVVSVTNGNASVRSLMTPSTMLTAVPEEGNFSFSSSDEMAHYPDKAYNGMRATLASLAERLAQAIVKAQRAGS